MNEPFIHIGKRASHQGGSPIGIHPVDARHHIYVIGKTGSGKSTLLRNLIVQHIALGHGAGLIDPHGDLAEDVLQTIPRHRADHLVYFNAGDFDYPVSFNPLAREPGQHTEHVVSGIVSAFRNLWSDSWGPRMEYILQNAIAALLESDNTSLLGVNRMLTDADYRRRLVQQVADPFVRQFWTQEFESYDPRFRREAIAPIQNKIGRFLLNRTTRNILGQVRNRIDIPFTIDNNRLFIANLAKGKIGEDQANLLGSLLVSQFQLATMARAHQAEEDRQDFHLFIDEFQNFTTEAFISLLAEARKYRLNLTLAHQYIAQVSPEIRKAVLGNVGTAIAFRVGYEDGEALHNEFGKEFTPSQFVDLDRFEIFVRLHMDGKPQVPIRGKALPPFRVSGHGADNLIQKSRQRFAITRETVDRKLGKWLEYSPE